MKLNLEAKTQAEQKIKAYLEVNASEILAQKINHGVRIQKDGKTLLNQKTLASFLKYACDEARKQAEKGAQSACIEDTIVYGWAVHYFEEDSIEGTLYNEDGTAYKAPMSKPALVPTKYEPPKPKPKPQMSIFDMVAADKQKRPAEEPDDEPTDEEIREAVEQIAEEEMTQNIDLETGEILSEEEMRQFDGDIDEAIPTVSGLLSGYTSEQKTDKTLAKEIAAVIDDDGEDDFDLSAFDAEAVAILSEIFGDELELR